MYETFIVGVEVKKLAILEYEFWGLCELQRLKIVKSIEVKECFSPIRMRF